MILIAKGSFSMAFKIASLVFLAVASGLLFEGILQADARGEFECPRMIDCSKVCQGFPYKCVDGKCICGEGKDTLAFDSASQVEAREQAKKSCSTDKNRKIICVHSSKCLHGQCKCQEIGFTP